MTTDAPTFVPVASSVLDSDAVAVPSGPDGGVPGAPPGTARCLSGGGYRAMLFHLGARWRLNKLSRLRRLARVSNASRRSIIAAIVGARWRRLDFDGHGASRSFVAQVVEPLRALLRGRA